jgi:Flp pilus assembly protein TadG
MKRLSKHLRVSDRGPRGIRCRARRRQRGQVAAEFAIVSVLMAALFAGMLDISRAWRASKALSAAVRDGARLAAIAPADKRVEVTTTLVKEAAAVYFEDSDVDVDVEDLEIVVDSDSTGGSQNVPIVTVTANANIPLQYGSMLPIGTTVDGQRVLPVSRSATFRNEVLAEEGGSGGGGGGGAGGGSGGKGGKKK